MGTPHHHTNPSLFLLLLLLLLIRYDTMQTQIASKRKDANIFFSTSRRCLRIYLPDYGLDFYFILPVCTGREGGSAVIKNNNKNKGDRGEKGSTTCRCSDSMTSFTNEFCLFLSLSALDVYSRRTEALNNAVVCHWKGHQIKISPLLHLLRTNQRSDANET